MQVISAVVLGIEARGIRGIAQCRREIDDSIKAAGSLDPGIGGYDYAMAQIVQRVGAQSSHELQTI